MPVKANGFQVIGLQSPFVPVCPENHLYFPDFCPFSCTFFQRTCKMQEKCKKKIKNRSCRHQLNFNERYEGFKNDKRRKKKGTRKNAKGRSRNYESTSGAPMVTPRQKSRVRAHPQGRALRLQIPKLLHHRKNRPHRLPPRPLRRSTTPTQRHGCEEEKNKTIIICDYN